MKKMVIAAALTAALVSCGDPPGSTGGTNGGTNTGGGASGSLVTGITGKVVEAVPTYDAAHQLTGMTTKPWSYGAATFQLVTANGYQGTTSVIASTPMAADGSFSLASLPAPADSLLSDNLNKSDSASPSCTDNVVVSDKSARGVMAGGSVTNGKGGLSAAPTEFQMSNSTMAVNYWVLYYVDRPVSITGSSTCTTVGPNGMTLVHKTSINVNLQKGWNSMKISSNESKTNATTQLQEDSMSNAALPAQWVAGAFGVGSSY